MKANTFIREIQPKFKRARRKTEKVIIKKSRDAYALFRDLKDASQEKLIAVYLAGDNSVVGFQVVHAGTIVSSYFEPADIIRTALATGAVAVIAIHNHPSGNVKPSPKDKKATAELQTACQLFKIKVFDHIIIGCNEYYSFADHGQLVQKEVCLPA